MREAVPAPAGRAARLILKPDKWNKHVQYGWRYDPCELASHSQMRRSPQPHARRAAPPPRARARGPVGHAMRRDRSLDDPSDGFE